MLLVDCEAGELLIVGEEPSYPSHFRPVDVHLPQLGLLSSHFFLRILGDQHD